MTNKNPIAYVDIYHCDKCDWKGKATEALHEEADDTYDLKCPRCQWEFVELLSPEKLLRMQCRNNAVIDIRWEFIKQEKRIEHGTERYAPARYCENLWHKNFGLKFWNFKETSNN